MSNAGATPLSWSGPGIIQSFVTPVPGKSKQSQETFEKWFDEEYVFRLLATGVVTSAWRFKAANPGYGKQNMTICKVSDLALVQAGKLQNIPRTGNTFDGTIDDLIESESRIFSLVQLYETTKQPEDFASTIIYAAMEPAPGGEDDLDAWYREEHNQQMSEQPGWKRTTRFDLLFQHRADGKESERLSFLALHEFGEGNEIGKDAAPLEPITDWTKKCMGEAKAIDAAVYQKVKSFGKAVEHT